MRAARVGRARDRGPRDVGKAVGAVRGGRRARGCSQKQRAGGQGLNASGAHAASDLRTSGGGLGRKSTVTAAVGTRTSPYSPYTMAGTPKSPVALYGTGTGSVPASSREDAAAPCRRGSTTWTSVAHVAALTRDASGFDGTLRAELDPGGSMERPRPLAPGQEAVRYFSVVRGSRAGQEALGAAVYSPPRAAALLR